MDFEVVGSLNFSVTKFSIWESNNINDMNIFGIFYQIMQLKLLDNHSKGPKLYSYMLEVLIYFEWICL